ncbi:MAG TPA: hypothetical protein VM260_00730, partial [Pirellula sp.]|nr:hypothetical protein [Pirellula sp.]
IMDSPINNIDELLSGMLDGTLSQAELVELEREMAKNPSLLGRLTEISAIRSSLSNSRSTLSLRADFASSVTLAAKKRAAQMGTDAPAWLVPIHKTLNQKPAKSFPLRSWIYAGSLALAASLLFVVFSIPKVGRQGRILIPEQHQFVANDSSANEDAKELIEEKALKDLVDVFAETGIAPTKTNLSPSESVNPESKDDAVAVNSLPLNSTSRMDVVQDGVPKPKNALANTIQDAVKPQTEQKGATKGLQDHLTLVLDVSIDPTAVENRTLEQILEKYRIVYTDDLVIDDTQLKNLEDSKMVGMVANSQEKMAVMFLRATAKQLDSALVDIINRFEDFPDFALDLTTDRSALMLVNQISSIKVADGYDGFASRLTLANTAGKNSPFAASAPRGKPMAGAIRGKFKGGMVPAVPGRSDMSNALILLRPAKK